MAPVSLNLANLSLTQLLNLASGSSESKASNISLTGVALVANLRFIKINKNAIKEVTPTKPILVKSILTHTLFKLIESNHK